MNVHPSDRIPFTRQTDAPRFIVFHTDGVPEGDIPPTDEPDLAGMVDLDDEPVDALACPTCSALNEPMGALGDLVHYSCRCCGMWYDPEERS